MRTPSLSISTGPDWLTCRWGIAWGKHHKRINTPWFTLYIES